MKATGGGAIGTSPGLNQRCATLYPNGRRQLTAWTAEVDNNETQTESGSLYVVRGKLRNSTFQNSVGVVGPSGSQTSHQGRPARLGTSPSEAACTRACPTRSC
jgi:hypothetical protein